VCDIVLIMVAQDPSKSSLISQLLHTLTSGTSSHFNGAPQLQNEPVPGLANPLSVILNAVHQRQPSPAPASSVDIDMLNFEKNLDSEKEHMRHCIEEFRNCQSKQEGFMAKKKELELSLKDTETQLQKCHQQLKDLESDFDRHRDQYASTLHRFNQLREIHKLPPVADDSPALHEDVVQVCPSYNKLACPTPGCRLRHVCAFCHDSHPLFKCDKDPNLCIKYNVDNCRTSPCSRHHQCLRCGKKHPIRDCPEFAYPEDICYGWNASNKNCRVPSCPRSHQCLRCRSTEHPSPFCPLNVMNVIENALTHPPKKKPISRSHAASRYSREEPPRKRRKSDRHDVCRDFNNDRCRETRGNCRFRHVCMICDSPNHMERACPQY
jgi:hypothetical protein